MTHNTNLNQVIGWISGADLIALNAKSSYIGKTQWQCYSTNSANPPFTAAQIIGFTPSATDWTFNPDANGAWVAVRIDEAGNIKGVAGVGNEGFGVHQSCWASFRPRP